MDSKDFPGNETTCGGEGGDAPSSMANQHQHQQHLKQNIIDCLANWSTYLQSLNNVCTAGLRLSQCLGCLATADAGAASSATNPGVLAQRCQASWEELARATVIAAHAVRAHIMQEMAAAVASDTDAPTTFPHPHPQHQHQQDIATENLLTFINLHYQFSLAGYDCLGEMASCPYCQAVAGASHDADCCMASLQRCFFARSKRHPPGGDATPSPSPSGGSSSNQSELPVACSAPHRNPSPVHQLPPSASCSHSHACPPLPLPGQLHTMKAPFAGGGGAGGGASRGSRSPLNYPLFPLRRWSEVASSSSSYSATDGGLLLAQEAAAMRRWSMPCWDRAATCHHTAKLAVPPGGGGSSSERSRSATPDNIQQQPAVVVNSDGLAEAIQLLSCRSGSRAPPTSSVFADGEDKTGRRLQLQQTAQQQQLQQQSQPQAQHPQQQHQSHHVGMGGRGAWVAMDSSQSAASRKSSSSTDSSSCLSIHSRSASSDNGGPESIRLHSYLYSMWSGGAGGGAGGVGGGGGGSDAHLPFIRLPESKETQEDSDEETAEESYCMFPKPT